MTNSRAAINVDGLVWSNYSTHIRVIELRSMCLLCLLLLIAKYMRDVFPDRDKYAGINCDETVPGKAHVHEDSDRKRQRQTSHCYHARS
eukprot:COSAG02_NODE_3152_length_7273_cov_30.318372_2_plen_89_part_00